MAKKPWFKVVNKAGETPNIYIYGIIGESWWSERSVTCNQFVEQLNALAEEHTEINVRVNSPGGSVWDGMAIVTAISQCKATVNTYIDGIAYSMGAIIALAGKKVHASSMSRFMLHTALTGAYGNSKDLRTVADELDGYNTTIAQLVADKTGKTMDEVMKEWFDHTDHYFSPEEMLTANLVDEIIPIKSGKQNFGKMSIADAFDYFTKLEDAAEGEEEEETPPIIHNNSIETDMKLEKFNALVNKIRQGELVSAEEMAAAQAELSEAGVGMVLISPQDNLVRNQNAQTLAEIKALLPEGAAPVAAIQAIQQENADVRACFANAAEAGFNLVEATRQAVADAAAYAASDGDNHNRGEHQSDPPGATGGKDGKAVLTAHYNKMAAAHGMPTI